MQGRLKKKKSTFNFYEAMSTNIKWTTHYLTVQHNSNVSKITACENIKFREIHNSLPIYLGQDFDLI